MLGVRSALSAPPRPRFGSLLGSLGLLSAACALPHAPLPRDGGRDSARPDAARPDVISTDVVLPPMPDVVVILPGSDASCAPPTISCGDRCVDPMSDPANCGVCGMGCARGARCSSGSCACPPGEAVCNNVCVNFATDPANCGGCMIPCRAGLVCSGGVCTSTCPAPRTMCGPSCTDTSTDNTNCGRCGARCPVGATCVSGSCPCPAGTTDCASVCVNTANDPRNCGGCGQACSAPTGGTASCASGSCVRACPADQTLCGAMCQPRNNPATCGPGCTRCIAPINGTVTCDGMRCVPACNMGFRLDGSLCVPNMPPPPPPPPGSCGNRTLEMNEECEDGNTMSGDGCSATCTVEPGVFNDTCSGGALTVPLARNQTVWFRGTTVGAMNNYDTVSGCSDLTGPDLVLRYRPAVGGTVTLTLDPVGTWDLALRGSMNCPGDLCLDRGSAGGTESVFFGTLEGQSWTVTVDGFRGAAGPFVLRIDLR